ncbi:LCP family protein [Nocardia cyriacigeorgica]|uniref:LCP family protein n=1 Tax=Nocardia cyriacigeorgica TaxID=135487 RepID=UPI00280608B5|nr:LCP family protein [Nocardia cyriacigeorgica]
MGDDRHGHAPRPGGRAPWERYPAAGSPERDGFDAPRRARHADPADAESPSISVQDLVNRVDSERISRRRSAEPGRGEAQGRPAPTQRPDTASRQPVAPAQRPAPGARQPRPAQPPAGAEPTQRRTVANQRPAAPPPADDGRRAAQRRGEPTQRRAVDPTLADASRPPGEPAPRGRETGAMRRQPEATGRRAEPTRRSGDPEAGPNRPDPKRRQAASGAPVSAAPSTAAGRGRQSGSTPARGAGKTGASPVVQDIAGTADTTRRTAEPPEEVTDVIAPVEQTKHPGRGRGKTGDWPTTDTATPEAVGAPKRTRLAESKLRKHRKARMAGRAALAISAAVALLITGGGWSYLRASGNGFTQVSALGDNSEDVIDGNAQLGDENYLIVGTDTRAGANGKLGAGTIEDAEGARADTVLLVHVPKNRQRVVVVSFPRDLDVSRPECKGWDNAKNDYTEETYEPFIGDKLNAVYALGGPRCLVSTIQRLTGSTINHFIGIDFAGFEAMVDQVGGVQVCTTEPLIDGELGTVLEKPGKQIINGATALNYVRARKVYGEIRGDYDRINRQQKFLASLLRTALSSKVLLDLGKLNGFIKAFTQATFVDKVKPDDLLTLGRSLADVNAGAVTFLTIPTSGTNAYGNEIPRESDIKAIFKAIRDDRPLPGEKPGAAAPTPADTPTPPVPPSYVAVDPSTVSLLVSNGSGISGQAATVANKLNNVGFPIYNTGNYTGGTTDSTIVRYEEGYEAEAATVASAIPGATMSPADAGELGGIIEVVLGTDYQGVIGEPAAVGEEITDIAAAPSSPTQTALPEDLEHINAADDICA